MRPFFFRAVRALYDIKGRDARKPIAISVADVEDVYKVGENQKTILHHLLFFSLSRPPPPSGHT